MKIQLLKVLIAFSISSSSFANDNQEKENACTMAALFAGNSEFCIELATYLDITPEEIRACGSTAGKPDIFRYCLRAAGHLESLTVNDIKFCAEGPRSFSTSSFGNCIKYMVE